MMMMTTMMINSSFIKAPVSVNCSLMLKKTRLTKATLQVVNITSKK